MTIWIIILITGVLTYAMRFSGISLLQKHSLPPLLEQGLRFVPVTVLPAIIAQEIILTNGTPDISLANIRLVAGIVAALVAWFTKNIILTIIVGMGVLLLLQSVV